jgi:hypothetical protein
MVHGVDVLQDVIANMVALGRVSGPSLLWVGHAVAHVHQQPSRHVDKLWYSSSEKALSWDGILQCFTRNRCQRPNSLHHHRLDAKYTSNKAALLQLCSDDVWTDLAKILVIKRFQHHRSLAVRPDSDKTWVCTHISVLPRLGYPGYEMTWRFIEQKSR